MIEMLLTSGVGKWLLGALAAIVALAAAFFSGRSKGKAAGQQEAAGQVQEARQEAQAAKEGAAVAQATTEAVQARQEADRTAAAVPDDDLDAELAKRGILRENKP